MGWFINEGENTVKITKKCAEELFAAQEYENELWYDLEDVAYEGKLIFNSDHMEHMDWIANYDHLAAVLKKNKVKGRICFESHEGDNAGAYWGYEFDGKGGMVELVGKATITWEKRK